MDSASHPLAISIGRWVFHGETLETPFSKPGKWIWVEDCRWSGHRTFLLCSFTNNWSGKIIKSLVVDTYNSQDKGYWHYELFAAGATGKRVFVSRMTISGNTWTEYGQHEGHDKNLGERIVYHYLSATEVSVNIQVSKQHGRWITVDRGQGSKQE